MSSSLVCDLAVPKASIRENLLWRDEVLLRAEDDEDYQKDLFEACRRDILFFTNSFAWTYDPRTELKHLPFLTWSFQDEYLLKVNENIDLQRDFLTEKSRDMGTSWMVIVVFLWRWLFHRDSFLIGSRKEELVDKHGDITTHFERLRYLRRHLPVWMLPRGFIPREHETYMKIVNPENGNAITGEATNDSFSRQGRYRAILLDEYAFVEHPDSIWTACGDSTRCRLPLSTPNGLGNKFASLRRSDTIEVVSLHWSKHPQKSVGMYCPEHGKQEGCVWPKCKVRSAWYDAENTRRSPLEIASELDIDYLSSGHPYFPLDALEQQTIQKPKMRGFLVELDNGVEFREDKDGQWSLWEVPCPKIPNTNSGEFQYVVGADPSEGIGEDFSVAVVRSGKTRNLVASLACHMAMHEFAYELSKIGRFYHFAKILCEREGPGFAVNAELVRTYGNLYHEIDVSRIGMPQTKRFGFATTTQTRPLILSQMSEEIRLKSVELRDARLIEECRTFVVDGNGRPGADSGFHDDFIFAFAIAGFGLQHMPTRLVKRQKQRERPSRTSLVG